MTFETIERDIHRPINGVVKADQRDASSVWQELDEFVVTDELNRHFSDLIGALLAVKETKAGLADRNGIWVSGFFGCGKSHLIKVLSFLLENHEHEYDGQKRRAVDFFADKFDSTMLPPGRDLNQRDTIAVIHIVSGLLKLLYPHEEYGKEEVRECLEYALETRRRIKEQLKGIGGLEFLDLHLSYIDLETSEERIVTVKEQGGDTLIPEGPLKEGSLHTVVRGSSGQKGLYRLETQVTAGNGQLKLSGFGSSSAAKESVKVGFDYFRANASQLQANVKPGDHDYHVHLVEGHNTGPTAELTMASFVALCSALLNRPLEPQMIVLGNMRLGGSNTDEER